MKNSILLATLLSVSSAAFADMQAPQFLSSPFVRGDIRALAITPGDQEAALTVQEIIIKSPESARNAFQVWSQDEQQAQYPAWPEVGINMLRWLEPARGFDWKSGARLPGATAVVYQQDSLVDLDRTMAVNVAIPTTVDNGYGYAIYDTARAPSRVPATSRSLLAQGYAPIGPDNIPVQVCKLGAGSQAPFVEISQTQRIRFQSETGLSWSACLGADQTRTYWKSRYSDFVDSYYDITSRHHPQSSY
jgi:hypothetical protein